MMPIKKTPTRRRLLWQADRKIELKKVLIVESNRPDELYEQRREGVLLRDLLRLLGIKSVYRVCVDKERLTQSFREARKGKFDAVHISCHGTESGISLTTGREVKWDEFAKMCGTCLEHKLLVLSACNSGARDLSRSFAKPRRGPGIIVGTEEEIAWDDAALAWQLLYKWLSDKKAINESLQKVAQVLGVRLVYRRWVKTAYRKKSVP